MIKLTRLLTSTLVFAGACAAGRSAADPVSPETDLIKKIQSEMQGAQPVEALPDPSVPKGQLITINIESKIFPGSEHVVKVYVPAQYNGDTPACLMIRPDGLGGPDMAVIDTLTARREIPVMIVVGLVPGAIWRDPPQAKNRAADRFNRSYEFDSMNSHLADYVIDEVVPAVQKLTTKEGRLIRISPSGSDHGAWGGSTGGVASFTLAWERPDYFTRIYSMIGTFVSMRGAHEYPALVRKTEPKAIRVFLEDGATDAWNPLFGSWYDANLNLESALTFAGYDVQHVWGDHAHTTKYGFGIFPDVLKWLWRDWPAPVRAGVSSNNLQTAILSPGQGWELVGEGYGDAGGFAADAQGNIFFSDASTRTIHQLGSDGKPAPWLKEAPMLAGEAFGPDGRLYGTEPGTRRIVAIERTGKVKTVAKGIRGRGILVTSDAKIYVTEPGEHTDQPSKLWLISPSGEKRAIDEGLFSASGLAFAVDQGMLFVAERTTKWVYSYLSQPDGRLLHKQPYYWLHMTDTPNDSGAEDMAIDTQENLYVATRMGIQVADANGRVRAILPLPTPCGPIRSLAFGGEKFGMLYATDGHRIYRRLMKVTGYQQWSKPAAKPNAGAG